MGDITVSNGSGSVNVNNDGQTLRITDLTLPPQSPETPDAELVVITADVLLDENLEPGDRTNLAFSTDLPIQDPPSIPSDDPSTVPYEEPTGIEVIEPVINDPNVRLVKRITALNRGLDNEQTFENSYVDVGTPNDDDNVENWAGLATPATIGSGSVESYLPGIASDLFARPGDRLEYTISFLSDGDAGYYFPANTEPGTAFPGINCGGTSDNGVVMVDLGDLPSAIAAGDPISSFGSLRFQVEID